MGEKTVKPKEVIELETTIQNGLKNKFSDIKINIFRYSPNEYIGMDAVSSSFKETFLTSWVKFHRILDRDIQEKFPEIYSNHALAICPVTPEEFENKEGPTWEE